jgi:hypothetical protein
VLKERWYDPEVCREVAALVGSLDDTLSDERMLEELKGLKAGGPTSGDIVADPSNN